MSKSRKEKLVEEIENNIERLEKLLIDTPDDTSDEEFQDLIKEIELATQVLIILKTM